MGRSGQGPSAESTRWTAWAAPVAAAFALRVAYWAAVTPRWVPVADADQYVQLSRNLADGEGFALVFPQLEMHATAFRPPLYPVLLTPGAMAFGNALWPGRLLSVLLGCAVVALAGLVAKRVAGRAAGLATAWLVACAPTLVQNDTITLSEPLGLALLLGAILLVDDRRWALGGLVLGALLLTRPNGYLVVAIIGAWAWSKAGWRQGALVGACAFAVLAPWLVRNRVQVGTWKPTTSSGFTLAAVYADPARDAGTFVDPVFATVYDESEHRWNQFDEAWWDRRLTEEAVDGIREDPGYVLANAAAGAMGYFEVDREANRYPEANDGRNWRFRQATLWWFVPIVLLGLTGLFRHRSHPLVIVTAALVAQYVVLSLVTVAPPRLRAPFDLAMCIGAGLAIGPWVAQRASAWGRRELTRAARRA